MKMRHAPAAVVAALCLGAVGCIASAPSGDVRWELIETPATTSTTTSTTSTTPSTTTAPPPPPTTAAPTTTAPPPPPPTTAAPSRKAKRTKAAARPTRSWVCWGIAPDVLHRELTSRIAGSLLPPTAQQQALRQLPVIEMQLPIYCAAEVYTGVPALALAAIHYREADNNPMRSIMSGEALGQVNPDTGLIEGTTPIDNAIAAARHLAGNARSVYGIRVGLQMSPIEMAYALASYNRGSRYCRAGQLHPMESPYVAAGLTPANVGMIWPAIGGDGPDAWGEPESVRGHPDPRMGALTLMRALGSEITTNAFAWNTSEVQIACR